MNETSGNAMGVNMDGASGNVDGKTQPNENSSEKIELSDLPREILEDILIHLNDKDMLKASHVCSLFASVAETAFARKYSEEWYYIDNNRYTSNADKLLNKVMLNKYGGKIRKIEIVDGNEEMLELVEQKCDNMKSLKLRDVPRIIMLKDLKEACFEATDNLDHGTFAKFIDLNPQLEALQFKNNDYAFNLNLLDGRLNNLKTLEFHGSISGDRLLSPIRLRSLETLQLGLGNTPDYIRLLQSMNCNQIKKLVLNRCVNRNGDDLFNEICQFESLASLDVLFFQITSHQVKKLATRLPRLTEFVVEIADGQSEAVKNILSMLSSLSKLTMKLRDADLDRVSNNLKDLANDFHALLARSNAEITLKGPSKMIVITTDYLFVLQGSSVELHWMGNLNEMNVRKLLNARRFAKTLKITNSWETEDKSNGSTILSWFSPHIILKVHLEHHSAEDFLRHLEEKFCEQFGELWLDTKGDADDPDITNTLAKFRNLKSLHLSPSSVNIDENYLFSVCPKLKEIKQM